MADRTGETTGHDATFRLDLLEVFAEVPLGGNLLAVVHDADRLADGVMQRLATRLRLSETSFVQSPTVPGADYRHRIFTYASELPFAGHPSLGTAAAVAAARGLAEAELCQETGAGLQRLAVRPRDGRSRTVELWQNPAEHLGEADPAAVLAALGLSESDLDPALAPAVVSTGLATLLLPLSDLEALGRCAPQLAALDEALAGLVVPAVTCYVVVALGRGRFRARCFTSQVASGEDAATGSAAGPLTAYAARATGSESVTIDQGVELGSPSRLAGRLDGDRVVVTGTVRHLGTGSLQLPVTP